MYKVASDNRQRALHQGRPSDWVNGDEKITLLQEYEAMRARDVQLDGQIRSFAVGTPERQALGRSRAELQARLKEIKAQLKAENLLRRHADVAQCFFDAAKDILIPGQYRAILEAARRLSENRKKEAQEFADSIAVTSADCEGK